MILSSEYKAIISECGDNLNRGICEDSKCQDCATIRMAYFLRYFTPIEPDQIRSLLGTKSAQVSELILSPEVNNGN
ncbi:hypothetical protein HOO68_06685 [Candidatus Gracilibacteria bacterium]|nr:hypothetical protein [Candidatus Gracilibacteria bacterium]